MAKEVNTAQLPHLLLSVANLESARQRGLSALINYSCCACDLIQPNRTLFETIGGFLSM